MTEDVRASPCTALTDRTRLDRLQGEILALVSQFEGKGYSNAEVVRELLAAALSGLAARVRTPDFRTDPHFDGLADRATDLAMNGCPPK
jgi:hypothetical protein